MITGNMEIVINNGDLRQMLMLPEIPIRIVFVFKDKELVLREQLGKSGLYFISHHRGFSKTDGTTHNPGRGPTLQWENEINNNHGDSGNPVYKEFRDSSNSLISQTDLSVLPTDANLLLLNPDGVRNPSENSIITNSQVLPPKCVCLPVLQNNLISIPKNPAIESPSLLSLNAQAPHYMMMAQQNELVTQPDVDIACLEKERTETENNPKVICETNYISDNESGMVSMNTVYSDESYDNPDNTHVQSTDNFTNFAMVRKEDRAVTQAKANISLSEKERAMSGDIALATCERDKTLGNENQVAVDMSLDMPGVKVLNGERVNTSLHEKASPAFKSRYKSGRCQVCNAISSHHPGRSFFRFPSNKEICQKWVAICNKPYLMKITSDQLRHFTVCSDHFADSDFRSEKKKRISDDAIPSRNLSLIQSMKAKLQLALHKSSETESTSNKMSSWHKKLPKKPRGISCCVPQCPSKKATSPDVRFYLFPADENIIDGILRQKWAKQLKIGKPVTDDMLVCSRHFLETDFVNLRGSTLKRLRKNVIPSQNLPENSTFIHPVGDNSHVVCLYDRTKLKDSVDIAENLEQIEVEIIYQEPEWLDSEETT